MYIIYVCTLFFVIHMINVSDLSTGMFLFRKRCFYNFLLEKDIPSNDQKLACINSTDIK